MYLRVFFSPPAEQHLADDPNDGSSAVAKGFQVSTLNPIVPLK